MDDAMQRPRDAAPSGGGSAAWEWLAAQIVLAVLAYFYMFLSRLSIASCTATSCDYGQYAVINTIYDVGAVVLLVTTAVGLFVFRRRPRVAMWFPIVGILLSAVLLVATYSLSRAALDLPLFGNRL
jgi:hypothetical protein